MVIVYAGNEFRTGDDIALALVDYSQALARVNTAESVEVPVRDDDGQTSSAVFLVGPASQLVAKRVPSPEEDELVDEAVTEELRARIRRLRPAAGGEFIDEWI
ncbi:hypothetical protein ACFUTX_11560 [Microbacterium sp. NPDC057407]|uniref:hypothetical protein n=1 Tax=Microbacterium sp. NPDC057407 TaxID=3346120 RepID=UPI003672B453